MPHSDDENPIRAVMLLPRYILMLAIFAVIGELFFMLYYDATTLVAGKTITLFSAQGLRKGLLTVIPAAMLISGAMLGVHRVRHHKGGVLCILSYIVLGAATWLLLFPALLEVMDGITIESKDAQELTKGYFREYGRDTVYLIDDFETELAAAVFINDYEAARDAVSIKMISRQQMAKDAAPYSDILVKNTMPNIAKWIADGFEHFTKRAKAAKGRGFLSWASFASLGAVLFSTYALSFLSTWPFMSVVIMLCMYAGCLSFNALYFSNIFEPIRALSLSLPFGSSDMLLTCINLALSVLFVLLGILSYLANARRKA